MPQKRFLVSLFFLALFLVQGFGQDIVLPSEATSPVSLSAEDFNRLVNNLRQATLDALLWNSSISERIAEIEKKENSIETRERDLNEKEQSLNRRDAILSESEADSEKSKLELTTLRSDLQKASKSLTDAESQASRLEFELFIWKGVAIIGTVFGLAGLVVALWN